VDPLDACERYLRRNRRAFRALRVVLVAGGAFSLGMAGWTAASHFWQAFCIAIASFAFDIGVVLVGLPLIYRAIIRAEIDLKLARAAREDRLARVRHSAQRAGMRGVAPDASTFAAGHLQP
jgi:hypothetical protein